MSGVGPVDHLPRRGVPWRDGPELTECGRPLDEMDPARVIDRAELDGRVRDLGKTRAAMTVCMTCWSRDSTHRHPMFDNPLFALERELSSVQHASSSQTEQWARRERLAAELDAIVALVREHRAEFNGYLTGLADTVSLADRRRQRRRR